MFHSARNQSTTLRVTAARCKTETAACQCRNRIPPASSLFLLALIVYVRLLFLGGVPRSLTLKNWHDGQVSGLCGTTTPSVFGKIDRSVVCPPFRVLSSVCEANFCKLLKLADDSCTVETARMVPKRGGSMANPEYRMSVTSPNLHPRLASTTPP